MAYRLFVLLGVASIFVYCSAYNPLPIVPCAGPVNAGHPPNELTVENCAQLPCRLRRGDIYRSRSFFTAFTSHPFLTAALFITTTLGEFPISITVPISPNDHQNVCTSNMLEDTVTGQRIGCPLVVGRNYLWHTAFIIPDLPELAAANLTTLLTSTPHPAVCFQFAVEIYN